ncbi:mitochondrial import inner membrane translocase subunit Tim29-like [Agrilus planipennis]|uniref:Mitochondrial import inner membrane translocase subunit Tim29-like n=1 Tax=Agrilus planipennis TaxID=224129 RepID=A0A1W4X0V1_AGRPL|nr:mitochondrial import inner membrane translocase subunit Tim29-like [Agrilus planipennis]
MSMIKIENFRSSLRGRVNNFLSKFQSTFERIEKKAEGTFTENWVKFWKNVFVDYKEVAVDIAKDVKHRPIKAAVLVSTAVFISYLFKSNPSEADYRAAVIRAANDIRLIPPSMQKEEAANFLQYIEQCYNRDLIRRISFGIACIIWVDKYNKDYKNEEAVNKYLAVTNMELFNRIVDIGILNRWFILPKKMEDYDVNF